MGSGKNSNYISPELMDLLDNMLAQGHDKLISDSTKLDPSSAQSRLSQLRGQEDVVQFIYNALPKEIQNGWTVRRAERPRPGGVTAGGGEGATQSSSLRSQRRKKSRSKERGSFTLNWLGNPRSK